MSSLFSHHISSTNDQNLIKIAPNNSPEASKSISKKKHADNYLIIPYYALLNGIVRLQFKVEFSSI